MSKTSTRPSLRPDRPGGSAALGATTQSPCAFGESSRRGRRSHAWSHPRESAPLAQPNVAQANPARWPRQTRDSGFALVVGLLLLVVMSVLGVTMVNITRLETLMAGGSREANIAFQATEAALRDAELRIEATGALTDFPDEPWFRAEDSGEPDFFAAVTWSDDDDETSSVAVTVAYPELGAQGSEHQPRCVIKHVGDVADDATEKQAIAIGGYAQGQGGVGGDLPPTSVFRITARGTSRDGSAETILQSYFGKVYE